jgi:glycosyltransferase involved in cell wall biosynthesis
MTDWTDSQAPRSRTHSCRQVMALIPAYNAGEAVGRVVREVAALEGGLMVLVIDDGSTDGTAVRARQAGASVVSHPRNMGKGAALRTGFEHFLRTDLSAVVTLDADGQHAPGEIPSLVQRWEATGADIIIGTRRRDPSTMPPLRVVTNAVSSFLVSLAAGRRIQDSQSGFRLLSRRVIEKIEIDSDCYAAESEMLIKAGLRGMRVESVPVSTIYADERSYVHPFKQPVKFVWLILRSILWRFQRSEKP